MSRQNASQVLASPQKPVTALGGSLQRKCACGNHTILGEPCSECAKKMYGGRRTSLPIAEPRDIFWREAGRIAHQVPAALTSPPTGDEAFHIGRFSGQTSALVSVERALASPGVSLEPRLRQDMERRFGHDFSDVKVHTDTQAARSAQAIRASAYTVGRDVIFAPDRYAPMTCAGEQLLAHELTHVIQQQRAAPMYFGSAPVIAPQDEAGEQQAHDAVNLAFAPPAARLGFAADVITYASVRSIQRQPNDLAAYPENERRRIRVGTIPVGLPGDLSDMFTAPRGSTTGHPGTSYSVNGTVVYGTGIPTTPPILRLGLASIGGWMAGSTNALPLNSTVTLAIDLTPYGGANAHYRFTYFAHTRRGRTSNVMLIEQLGPVGNAPARTMAAAGAFSVRGQNFTLASGWTSERYALLRLALERLPDVALREAAGITFYQRGRGTPDEAGHYLSGRDAVEMHDNAFPNSALRFGDVQSAVRAIVHELGHVLDLRRMERAWRTFDQAGQTSAAKRTLLRHRSLSGVRWRAPAGAGGTYTEVEEAATIRGSEFRRAVQQDGTGVARDGHLSGGITTYGNTDWEEYFAEAFSIYVTDPHMLEQLRPHVFRYFTRHFPLPARGGSPATPHTQANP